jgi:outer membrane protein assembly factor BamB
VAGDVSEWKGSQESSRFDVFLSKYDRDGNLLWTREHGSAPGIWNDDLVTSLAVDPLGGVYVAGYTDGSFEGATAGGSRDMFVVKFDHAGNRLWARQYGDADFESANALAADPDGGVYVAGVRNPSDGGGPIQDALLGRYSADGTLLWIRQISGGWGGAVAMNRDAVYLAGSKADATPRGMMEPPQGPSDALLTKFSRDGALLSVRLLGGPRHDGALGVAIGLNGDAYIAINTSGGLPGVPNPGAALAHHREAAP